MDGDGRGSKPPASSEKKAAERKGGKGSRPGDLGRALRSAYDDTLREPVPDDFMDLLGKLS